MSPLVSDRMAQCPINSSLVPGLCFPLPWGGEETTSLQKKKDACALPDLFGLPFLDALMRASRRLPAFLHCRSTYYVVCRCPCGSLHKEKKRLHTRATIATPPQCRQWSNQMLLPCGALLAVRDGLKTAVRASGRFLRSAVFLCIA